MEKSESIKEICEALVKAQSEMPSAKMNKTNPFLKNRYADLGSIIEASQPILAKHGLAISQHCTTEGEILEVETILLHKSGEWISSKMGLPMGDEKGKSQSQVAGSIITYIRRYSLAAILGMYSDEDGDGNLPVKQIVERASEPLPAPANPEPIIDTDKPKRTRKPRESPGTPVSPEKVADTPPKETSKNSGTSYPFNANIIKDTPLATLEAIMAKAMTDRTPELVRPIIEEIFPRFYVDADMEDIPVAKIIEIVERLTGAWMEAD